jgi:hypothetical protein
VNEAATMSIGKLLTCKLFSVSRLGIDSMWKKLLLLHLILDLFLFIVPKIPIIDFNVENFLLQTAINTYTISPSLENGIEKLEYPSNAIKPLPMQYRFAIVADLDLFARDKDKFEWHSYLEVIAVCLCQ